MRTKLHIIIIIALSLLSQYASASIAYPGWIDYIQPDGSSFKMKLIGDEFGHYGITSDNYTVLPDSEGFYCYALKDINNDLVPSKIRALNPQLRPDSVNEFLRTIPKGLALSREQTESIARERQKKAPLPISNKAPVVGERSILVILVSFKDKACRYTADDIYALMNEPGYGKLGAKGSVNDFYREASGGKLDLKADVYGPVTLSRELAYYGENIGGSDARPRIMAQEAAELADESVDFSKYDHDGDGVIDGVHFIYAGYGEEAGGDKNCIWAHKWTTSGTFDGVRLHSYSCSPELRGNVGFNITHIGTICHEIGHVLGCMDFYDTDYSVNGQYSGTGNWDLMASGNWNDNGASPAKFNPYVCSHDFGWQEQTILDVPNKISIRFDENTVYRLNTQDPQEYFLLENRQQSGFDKALPGHGLVIYKAKVDGKGVVVNNSTNKINSAFPQNFYIVSANAPNALPDASPSSYGVLDASASFPGTLFKEAFTDETTPSCRASSGLYSDAWIENISEDADGNITFTFGGGSGNPSVFEATEITESSIHLTWKLSNPDLNVMLVYADEEIHDTPEGKSYAPGDTIGNARVLYIGKDREYTHNALTKDTPYYYRVYTMLCENPVEWSRGVSLSLRTIDPDKPQYIFLEDFSASIWEEELVTGGYHWAHGGGVLSPDGAPGVAVWNVTGGMYAPDGFSINSSRLVSPESDLSRVRKAAVTFDYEMGDYQQLNIYYRLDRGEWKFLQSYSGRTPGWQSVVIELPERSKCVELGMTALHHIQFGSTLNKTQAYIHLDNIGVITDYKVLPITQAPIFTGNRSVEIPIRTLEGTVTPDEYGVEITTAEGKIKYLCDKSDMSVTISDLVPNTAYRYSSFASVDGEDIFGEERSFTTLNYTKGDGSKQSPFQVTCEDDLFAIAQNVADGFTFKDCHFELTNDIEMSRYFDKIGCFSYPDNDPVKYFDGCFDGKGHTLRNFKLKGVHTDRNVQVSTALFGCIGQNGVVKHLTIDLGDAPENSQLYGIVANCNFGAIIDCHTTGLDITTKTKFKKCGELGFIATINYGIIASCDNKINFNHGAGYLGGICAKNYSVITNCINYGNLIDEASFGAVGGIAGFGSHSDGRPNADDRTYLAEITNCVNYGDVRMDAINEPAKSLGGIVGITHGSVKNCANYGNLSLKGRISSNIGGIIGNLNSHTGVYCINFDVSNCLNTGEIECETTGDDPDNVFVGGIVGGHNHIIVSNCCNTGKITMKSDSARVDAIVPLKRKNNSCGIKANNNYYLIGSWSEPSSYGTEYSSKDQSNVVSSLNKNSASEEWHSDGTAVTLDNCHPRIDYICNPCYLTPQGLTLPVVAQDARKASVEVVEDNEDMNPVVTIPIEGREYTFARIEDLKPKTPYKVRIANEYGCTPWYDIATTFLGTGSLDKPFEIDNLEDLKVLRFLCLTNNLGATFVFRQTSSIDLHCDAMHPWKPFPLYGLYDGANHSITNLYVDDSNIHAGFFSYILGGVTNLSFIGNNSVMAPNSMYSGGICGYYYKTTWNGYDASDSMDLIIENCTFHGTVAGDKYTGGIAGYTSSDFKNCGAVVNLSGNGAVGGLTGNWMTGKITGCYTVITSEQNCSAFADNRYHVFVPSNNYYREGDNIKGDGVRSATDEEMKSERMPSLLDGEYWTVDTVGINGGYPILSGYAKSSPTVNTGDAVIADDGSVELFGASLPTNKKVEANGIEWRHDIITGIAQYQDTPNMKDSDIDIYAKIGNVLPGETYSYSAYAIIDGEKIYGAEKQFRVKAADGSRPEIEILDSFILEINPDAVKISADCIIDNVDIYNIDGVKVKQAGGVDCIMLRGLLQGIYIVNVTIHGKTTSKKIIMP